MAGVLFIVSLPKASFETLKRNAASENVSGKPRELDKTKYPQVPNKTGDLEPEVNLRNFTKDQGGTKHDLNNIANRLGSKSVPSLLEHISRMKNLNSEHSVSDSTIQNPQTGFIVDIEDDKNRVSSSLHSLPRADSTEVFVEETTEKTKPTIDDESEVSLISPGGKLEASVTPTNGFPSSNTSAVGKLSETIGTMETLLKKVFLKLGVDNDVWNLEKNGHFYQVLFTVDSGDACEDCLQLLNEYGFGVRVNTTVSVIPCTLFYKGGEDDPDGKPDGKDKLHELEPEDKDLSKVGCVGSGLGGGEGPKVSSGGDPKVWNWNRFVASVRARLTVAQVVESVRANAELTFDFIALLLVAGMVAAMGLVENSSVTLVASMLISPLMGPILAGTFGIVVQDRQLQKIGVLNEVVGLASCITVGFVYGLIIGCATDHWGPEDSDWPTQEMMSRGVLRCLWVGVLIALPSGAGVALSVLGGNTSSLVGVAISASLLPPAVNAGLFWALSVITSLSDSATISVEGSSIYSENESAELAMLGFISLCLTLVNIICIFVAAILVLKVKEVAPQTSIDDMRRFWKHDIKIARDYNRTMHGDTAENLGKQLLDELSRLPKEEMEAIVEEAAHGRQRFSLTRHTSESGVLENRDGHDGNAFNQYTWTPGTNVRTLGRSGFHPRYRRSSITVPSDEEVEDIVYATLTAGSRQGYLNTILRPGGSSHMPYRKISSTSWHGSSGHQIRSPTRIQTLEPQLVTIKESATSLPYVPNIDNVQATTTSRRFQVTPCAEEGLSSKKARKASKAPLAKSDA